MKSHASGNGPDDAVVVTNLVKRFGSFVAVGGVSFTVRAGTIFGFLGPNGAGKTTTIRILLGLLKPTEGAARILGYDVTHETQMLRRRIGPDRGVGWPKAFPGRRPPSSRLGGGFP